MTNFETFWNDYLITDNDIFRIYNHLLETETPSSHVDLAKSIILEQIQLQNKKIETEQLKSGVTY